MANRQLTSGTLLAGVVALLSFVPALFGQTAQVTGRVTDQAGAVVPNAAITITNTGTGVVRKTASSQDGYFTVPLLQPGLYQISLEMTGFKAIERTGVQLAVDQILRMDFSLELGSVSDKVQVIAQAETLESETATLAQLIQGKQILDLPLLGRNPYALAGLAPGVRTSIGMNDIPVDMISTGSVSINGQRGNQNEYLLDGAPNTGASQNQPIIFANVDSVQEFRVETNAFSAAYGRAAGGIFNVVTKSGTNQVHFSAYEFLRNDKLNANDWFANRGGVNRPPFRFNQFGGTLGLPVVIPHLYNGRNKTFLFVSTELVRFAQGVTFTGTVPDAAMLSGDFSNLRNAAGQKITIYDPRTTAANPTGSGFIRTAFLNNVVPTNRISPMAAAIAKFWPAPNTTGAAFTGVGNYVNTGANIIDNNTYSVRLDHSFSEKDHFFTRYSYDDTPKISAGPYGQTNPASPAGGTQDFTRMNAVIEETHIFNPSLIGEFRASFSRFSNFRNPFSDGFDMTTLGFSPGLVAQLAGLRAFPAISVTGYSVAASVPNTVQGGPSLGADGMINIGMNNYALQSAITKTFARHTVKFGGEYRIVRFNALQTNDSATQFTFASSFTQGPNPTATTAIAGNALATFLLGIPGGVTAPSPALAQQTLYAAGFFQDDWKVTANLTVNLGLRYEVEFPRTDRFNQLTNFDPGAVPPLKTTALNVRGALTFAGVNGLSRFQAEPDLNNFAPRAGIAWRVTPKTVVRTGGGVFYSSLTGIGSAPNVFGTTGFLSTTNITTSLDGITPVVTLNNPFPDGVNQPTGSSLGPATFLGQTANFYDRSNRVPLSFQWNLDMQRELPKSVLLDIGYVGTRGLKLPQDRLINQLPDSALPLGDALRQLVPNPFFGQIAIGPLSQATVARAQLLRPYPQFQDLTSAANSWGSSNYHALQVKLEKRYSRGFTFLTSYTYSKMMDYSTGVFNGEALGTATGSGVGGIQNWNNLKAEYSPSSLDQTHRLIVNSVYEFPFFRAQKGWAGHVLGGWEIGAIGSFYSGGPLGITSTTNNTFSQGGGQRPNWNGVNPALADPTPAQWINPAVFSNPPAYQFGTAPRTFNSLRSDSSRQVDLSLHKNTNLTERLKLQFRAEAFNLANTPRFAPPNTSFGNAQFGVVSAMENQSRVLQFALKLLL